MLDVNGMHLLINSRAFLLLTLAFANFLPKAIIKELIFLHDWLFNFHRVGGCG
jgi:hypothetical protein